MLSMWSDIYLEGSMLQGPAEVIYTLNPQSWSWQQAEYLLDAFTLDGLRQNSQAQLVLTSQDTGENLKIILPKALLEGTELAERKLSLYLNFTSDANSRLRSRDDYFWVILSQAPGQLELLMRPTIVVQESHWPPGFFQEVIGAWGEEFDEIEARLQQITEESEP